MYDVTRSGLPTVSVSSARCFSEHARARSSSSLSRLIRYVAFPTRPYAHAAINAHSNVAESSDVPVISRTDQ
jgi:hypothetical protein